MSALCEIGAVGREKALPRRDVLLRFRSQLGQTMPSADRCLRIVMSAAPDYGIPLVSSNEGYFVATEQADFDVCLADLSSRRGEISKRIEALERLRDNDLVADGRLF